MAELGEAKFQVNMVTQPEDTAAKGRKLMSAMRAPTFWTSRSVCGVRSGVPLRCMSALSPRSSGVAWVQSHRPHVNVGRYQRRRDRVGGRECGGAHPAAHPERAGEPGGQRHANRRFPSAAAQGASRSRRSKRPDLDAIPLPSRNAQQKPVAGRLARPTSSATAAAGPAQPALQPVGPAHGRSPMFGMSGGGGVRHREQLAVRDAVRLRTPT